MEATARLKRQGLKNGGSAKKGFVARGCGAIMKGKEKRTRIV